MVLGLPRLARKLRALPERAKTEISKAMEESANEIVALAKSLVPVSSGDLRDSIGWTWGAAPEGAMTLATVGARSGNIRITVYAGSDKAYYARWVEFGTQAAPANPFFYVSYRALRKRAKGRISRAISRSARAVAAGG